MSEQLAGIQLPKRKRNPDDGELDITPMIDVTFLLLAFFVVVSKMDPQAAVALPEASYGQSVPDKNCVVLILTLDDTGEEASVYKGRSMSDDSKISAVEREDIEQEIADYVEEQFSNDPTKSAVLVKAEGNCKTGMVEMVKRGVGKSELARSDDRRIYIGIEEKQ